MRAAGQQPCRIVLILASILPGSVICHERVLAQVESGNFVAKLNAPSPIAMVPTASDPHSRDLQDIMIRAMADLDVQRLPNLEAAKLELAAAIEDLNRFVQAGTNNGDAWRRFLRLDELEEEVNRERPSLSVLTELEMNMYQNYLGLEYPQFMRVRDALNRVLRATKYGIAPDRTIDVLNRRMEQLVQKLDEPPEGAATETTALLGLVLTYLHESEQTPWAVQEVKSRYSLPNVQVQANEKLINQLLLRPVAEPSPVNECLLGTRVIGTACLEGSVSVDILPMLDGVSLNLNLSACLSSINKGYNRGVVFHTTGTSPVLATKQVFVTPNSISSTPATVATNLRTQINAIEHRLKIVRRIAKKKSAEQKPQADAIAQGRLQNRVRTQYDDQVNEQLAEANVKLQELQQPRPEFVRLGIPRPAFAVYSTDSGINGHVMQAASFQLTANKGCPLPIPADAGALVQVHQSSVVNALDLFLTGRTIRSEDVVDLAKQFLGEVPEEIRAEAENEHWSITLASYRPLQIELDDGQIKVTLEMSNVSGENGTINGTSAVTATYAVQIADGEIQLLRQGEVITDFGSGGGGIRNTTLRSLLKKKFDTVFKEVVDVSEIDLEKAFPNIARLAIHDFSIDDGWVQVAIGAR